MKQERPTSMFLRAGLLTAALCAVAVTLLVSPSVAVGAAGAPTPPVDVNAPVSSGTQCAPCHARIAEAIRPGLIFTHGSHLLVSCDGCHWGPPHRGAATLRPVMESCFNCHGVAHGAKPIARGDCAACHTKSFKLRPAWHGKDWKVKPHAERAKTGANTCLMCHDPKAFCDGCHVKEGLKLAPTQAAYRPILKREPARTPLKVYPDGQTTMAQCVKCHPDLDSFLPGRVIFAHGQHLQMSFRCESCHTKFGHGPDATYRPEMSTCYACHGLAHSSRALIATVE
ncbi:MAG: cytochrome c3 family protein, partial [Coriobacteriia bacterium]|nr:cytochrome c3 family protein [Coriobacteriia bacterium]